MSLLNLRSGLLLAALLAVASTAQAGMDVDELDSPGIISTAEARVVRPLMELTDGSHPGSPETPQNPDSSEIEMPEVATYTGEADKTAGQAQTRLGNTVSMASDEAGYLEGLIWDEIIAPAEDAVRGAQDSLPSLESDHPGGGENEPAPSPMSADLTAQWPSFATPVLIAAGAAASFGFLFWLLGNSATVGAGAAGTALARGDPRRFLPFASPLFTRFEKDTVLGHPKREAIYGQIIEKPGITLQDLCQASGLSRTAVTHHLRLLEQQHLVVSKRVGRSRHFFENGGRYGRDQKDAYAVLHNDRSKDICDYIKANPGAIQKDLCEAMDIQASVAHWHVKRLVEAQLIESVRQGRTVSYFPAAQMPTPAQFS